MARGLAWKLACNVSQCSERALSFSFAFFFRVNVMLAQGHLLISIYEVQWTAPSTYFGSLASPPSPFPFCYLSSFLLTLHKLLCLYLFLSHSSSTLSGSSLKESPDPFSLRCCSRELSQSVFILLPVCGLDWSGRLPLRSDTNHWLAMIPCHPPLLIDSTPPRFSLFFLLLSWNYCHGMLSVNNAHFILCRVYWDFSCCSWATELTTFSCWFEQGG